MAVKPLTLLTVLRRSAVRRRAHGRRRRSRGRRSHSPNAGPEGKVGGYPGDTLCIYGRRVACDRPGASMAVLVVIFCNRFSHISCF